MTAQQLMDALRMLDPHTQIGIKTHTDTREVKFVERAEDGLAVIDIRFSRAIDDTSDD
jgi:hypothetical protein